MENKYKMNTKKLLVSFLLIASVLFLATAVSAADITSATTVYVDSVKVVDNSLAFNGAYASVIAGETIEVKVRFTAGLDDDTKSFSNFRMKVELEGDKADVIAITPLFDVEAEKTYVKTLVLKVPSELKDELSDDLTMNVRIWNSDYETEVEDIALRVQRPSYDFAIKSVSTSNTINAGQSMPVEVVLKNVGYNDADDVYVTVSIPELNIEKSAYFGDLVALEDDDDEDETASGKLYLEVPYTAKTGVYTVVVEVSNDETTSTVAKEITIENGVSDLAIRSGNDLIVLNPTSQLKVYTVKYNDQAVSVVVPAVSSKNVAIAVPAGEYNFDVAVYSGEAVLSTVTFNGTSDKASVELTNPVFVLTVILSVVFLVLLVVLVVLITKKPQKAEEFGESYY